MSQKQATRRDFFRLTSDGLLGAALLQLLAPDLEAGDAAEPAGLRPKKTHHPAKARSVVHEWRSQSDGSV